MSSTGRSNDEKTNATFPEWQSDLIDQIIIAVDSFYCLPEKLNNSNKIELKNFLVEAFQKLNRNFEKDTQYNNKPSSKEQYNIFLDQVNKILESFDSHLNLEYNAKFITDMKQKMNINSGQFDLSSGPTEEELFEWNKTEKDNPKRRNYGFIDDPNVCSLLLISASPVGKNLSNAPTYLTTPTYILSADDGLYYINDPNSIITVDDLITSNRNTYKYEMLYETLDQGKTSDNRVLLPTEQQAITSITGHVRPKNNIPNNIGYLKISHLIDPQSGAESKKSECRLGPNAITRLNEAMNKLQGKEGIILDLSGTKFGGSPEMVQHIVSFFIKEKDMVINNIYDRTTDKTKSYKSIQTSCDLFNIPVAIITDKETFSGREEIAYDLQQYNSYLKTIGEQKEEENRFTIIGEITRGGAHPCRSFPLLNSSNKLNDDLILWIPYARSINPISKTNWEKTGIQADILIKKGENALEVAVDHLKSIIAKLDSDITSSKRAKL